MTPAEEIKAKLDIVEVVRDYVPNLKPTGTNFVALSPFNREKTASFVVSPEKQIWHCFSSGKGGDIFTFVMEMEGLSFPEALRLLAPKAGIVLHKQDPQLSSQRNRALDILQATADYYYSKLLHSPQAKVASQYLLERGLNREAIDYWQIGFSLESWDDLSKYLHGQGFKDEDIFTAGLSVRKQGSLNYYDRFRNRIMFPLRDINGNIVGFTGRVLPGSDDQAKYMNTPQTAVYDKSKVLFGLDKAKLAIKQQGYAVIMEGQMDVVTAHQFGFKNTIAASGTALTAEQIKLLDRYTNNIIFSLDADSAGQSATDKGEAVIRQFDTQVVEAKDRFGQVRKYIDPYVSYKKNIKVAILPTGQDPDDFIRKNKEGWIAALRQAKPIMEYYFDKALKGLDLSTVNHKKQAAQILLPLIARQTDVVDRDFWLRRLSQLLDIDAKLLYETLSKYESKTGANTTAEPTITPKALSRDEILSESLLALILQFSAYIQYILDYLSPEYLVGEGLRVIYKNLIMYYNEKANNQEADLGNFVLDYTAFNQWLADNNQATDSQKQLLDKLFILAEKDFYDYSPEQANLEIRQIAKILKNNYLNKRLKAITQLIAELEPEQSEANNKQELDSLLKEFNNLTEELRKLN